MPTSISMRWVFDGRSVSLQARQRGEPEADEKLSSLFGNASHRRCNYRRSFRLQQAGKCAALVEEVSRSNQKSLFLVYNGLCIRWSFHYFRPHRPSAIVIQKPFRESDLVTAIQRALDAKPYLED
jgi:hypothetical protein